MTREALAQDITFLEKQRDEAFAAYHQATGALLALQNLMAKLDEKEKEDAKAA